MYNQGPVVFIWNNDKANIHLQWNATNNSNNLQVGSLKVRRHTKTRASKSPLSTYFIGHTLLSISIYSNNDSIIHRFRHITQYHFDSVRDCLW